MSAKTAVSASTFAWRSEMIASMAASPPLYRPSVRGRVRFSPKIGILRAEGPLPEEQFFCPRCQLPLGFVEDKEVQFLGCQKCYGLWVAEPDLFVYVEKAASPR